MGLISFSLIDYELLRCRLTFPKQLFQRNDSLGAPNSLNHILCLIILILSQFNYFPERRRSENDILLQDCSKTHKNTFGINSLPPQSAENQNSRKITNFVFFKYRKTKLMAHLKRFHLNGKVVDRAMLFCFCKQHELSFSMKIIKSLK